MVYLFVRTWASTTGICRQNANAARIESPLCLYVESIDDMLMHAGYGKAEEVHAEVRTDVCLVQMSLNPATHLVVLRQTS